MRQTGGFGGGIVVNYLFAAVWLGDLVWWWVNPMSHASRPKWIGWVVHGFLAFVVVNATVVFGTPTMRGIYAPRPRSDVSVVAGRARSGPPVVEAIRESERTRPKAGFH